MISKYIFGHHLGQIKIPRTNRIYPQIFQAPSKNDNLASATDIILQTDTSLVGVFLINILRNICNVNFIRDHMILCFSWGEHAPSFEQKLEHHSFIEKSYTTRKHIFVSYICILVR